MAEPKDKKKKLKGFKEFNPKKYIDVKPTLDEAAMNKTAVISFGRMNPITAGHEKLAMKVISEASKRKGVPMIFLSHSQDKKKNPLSYDDKVRFATTAFGPAVKKTNARTLIEIAKTLTGKFKNLVFICGSDRVADFERLLNNYNGKDFTFESIEVVSAGQRDPDADDVTGISGTKMREFAADGDLSNFTRNLPKKLKSKGKEVMDAVREGMGMTEELEEDLDLDEALNRMQRRKRALAFKRARFKIKRGREKAKRRTATMEVLKKRARKAAIGVLKKKFSKNRRYAELSAGEKEVIDKRIEKISKKRIEAIARKLLPKVKQKELDRKHAAATKQESVNEACMTDVKGRKKPHMLLTKEGKVKFDGRFKQYKKKVNESTEDLASEINDLMEAVNEAEKKGLWANIHAKRERIKNGSGERMRKPGSKGAPTAQDFKDASESVELDERSPIDSLKVAFGKKFNKNYPKALEYMKKYKKSAADAARMYAGVDARELAKMSESLEEKLDKFGEPVSGSKASNFRKKELDWELRKEKPKKRYSDYKKSMGK